MGRFADTAKETVKPLPMCRMGRIIEQEFDDSDRTWWLGLAEKRKFTEIMDVLNRTVTPRINYKTMSNHAHGYCNCADGVFGRAVVKVAKEVVGSGSVR